jgi:hypothetical protein
MWNVTTSGGSSNPSRARKLLNHRSEPIQMEAKRFGYFPQTFVWHGRRYEVNAVERCWTVSHHGAWNVERHCFRVRCAEGTFDLSQDARHNTWQVNHFEPTSTLPAVARGTA